ncbi:hypothetical protein [Pseudomonas sp. RC10]|uniref:hypothetical protein n=1 Tax=Pseudomonas bambusae TaxID=3139142 RepID=UPI00313903BE
MQSQEFIFPAYGWLILANPVVVAEPSAIVANRTVLQQNEDLVQFFCTKNDQIQLSTIASALWTTLHVLSTGCSTVNVRKLNRWI